VSQPSAADSWCARNWVRENTGSGVEGILIWTENQTPFMVDRTPSLENEKVYDKDAGDTIPLSYRSFR
jgi:hypothetical protein